MLNILKLGLQDMGKNRMTRLYSCNPCNMLKQADEHVIQVSLAFISALFTAKATVYLITYRQLWILILVVCESDFLKILQYFKSHSIN